MSVLWEVRVFLPGFLNLITIGSTDEVGFQVLCS